MQQSLGSHYLKDTVVQFRNLKTLADKALAQVADSDLFAILDPESNSIAIIMKHLAGNMLSRWTEFLTSDGEKPDRNRDSEFEIMAGQTRTTLLVRKPGAATRSRIMRRVRVAGNAPPRTAFPPSSTAFPPSSITLPRSSTTFPRSSTAFPPFRTRFPPS